MTNLSNRLCAALVLLAMPTVFADEVPEQAKPVPEHALLKKFVGNWEMVSEAKMGEGQETMTCEGKMSGRMVGEFWVLNEHTGSVGSTSTFAMQTIGYDEEKKCYVGTWIDSMVNYLWRYEGKLSDDGTTLVMNTRGPNFLTDHSLTDFRDSYKFESPDHIIATSEIRGKDGKWIVFMTGHARRVK